MMVRFLAAPLRLCLGLPAFYGMSLGNRFCQIGRWMGVYKGPIHYIVRARTLRIGAQPQGLAQ